MILMSLALLGFASADLLRWSPEEVSLNRTLLALTGATGVTVGAAALSGLEAPDVVLIGTITIGVLAVWLLFDRRPLKSMSPGYPLAWILTVLLVALSLTGSADAISGPLESWYVNLPFPFVASVSVDEFLLGVAAGLFLLSTANRIVRLVLEAAGTPAASSESTLRGGRVLGPMERLLVCALVLAGDAAGAAIVIAAKGLLRLPEIRSSADHRGGKDDQVTEYFLIGTFTSLLLAAAIGGLILAAG